MAKWITRILITVGCSIMYMSGISAQDTEIISAETIGRLQSVQQIDYADFDADINIGWFAVNDDATEFMIFDNDSNLYRVSDDIKNIEQMSYIENGEEQIFSVIDGTFAYEEFYILYTLDGEYWANEMELDIIGIPLAIGHNDDFLYIEAQIDSELVIYQADEILTVQDQFIINSDSDQPVMRVGRIRLPYIVQSSFDGHVKISNYSAPIGDYTVDESPAVFGHINTNQSHFAWVDPNSTHLNLLDFETGENRIVAELDNLYAQYYLLSQDASLVIAINVDFTPNVIAWDTNTGQRYDLGEYRQCERIPDKVELSADGTTLVIGCDTGLDLWRIVGETETD